MKGTVKASVLQAIDQSFQAKFNQGIGSVPGYHKKLCMECPSAAGENIYGWLASLPVVEGDRPIGSGSGLGRAGGRQKAAKGGDDAGAGVGVGRAAAPQLVPAREALHHVPVRLFIWSWVGGGGERRWCRRSVRPFYHACMYRHDNRKNART